MREAMKAIEAEAKEPPAPRSEQGERAGATKTRSPKRSSRQRQGDTARKAQRNFTDPESRIMKTRMLLPLLLQRQAVVDEKSQVVLAGALTSKPLTSTVDPDDRGDGRPARTRRIEDHPRCC